jgi:hypothetical protein
VKPKHQAVVVIGSGQSLGNLTKEEIEYINNCEAVLALNLYFIFYKKLGVVPTHIFEIEFIYENDPVIRMMINRIEEDHLSGITFVLRDYAEEFIARNRTDLIKKQLLYRGKHLKKFFALKRSPSGLLHDLSKNRKILTIPQGSHVVFMNRNNYDYIKYEGEWKWAQSLNEPLFQVKSSLTACLNYISIKYRNYPVYLAGTDLNSGKYYYQEEMDVSPVRQILDNIIAKDSRAAFMAAKAKENDLYFPAQNFDGYSVFDAFPFVLKNMEKSNNQVFCVSRESALVTKGIIPFGKLPV